MATPLDPNEIVTLEELTLSNMRETAARVAVGPDHLVYVADSYNNCVQVFTPEGKFLRKRGGLGILGHDRTFAGGRNFLLLRLHGEITDHSSGI